MFLLEPGRPETLVHSASDLVLAGECEFRLLRRLDELLGRVPRRQRDEDEMLARTAALGDVHEGRVLASYQARFGVTTLPERAAGGPVGGVFSVPVARRMSFDELTAAHERTLAAVEHGADVVFQASFFDGRFHGRADFLVRDPLHGTAQDRAGHPVRGALDAGPARPAERPTAEAGPVTDGASRPRYAVYDSKLAHRAKVRALLQLAAYADQLIAARIDPTDQIHLILGDRSESHHDLGDVLPVFRRRRERLLQVLGEHVDDDAPADWADDRWLTCGRLGTCEDCAEAAGTRRDVLLVRGVYERQRTRLSAAGLTTIDALATADSAPEGMAAVRFETLREQARLQLGVDAGHGSVALDGGTAEGSGRLRWKIVDPQPIDDLPDPSPGDVFFDFEGDPLWEEPRLAGERAATGLDYLFGWVERPASPGGRPPFTGLWADDLTGERDALLRFVDHVNARRRVYPGMHVYHYAPYEKTHLLSIAARHGVYEDEVDDLLRDGVLVDLYAVVRSAVRTSGRSLSIKKLEPLYMGDDPAREGVKDAASSVIEYAEYCQAVVEGRLDDAGALRRRILEYNEYDCRSTLRLLDWLRWARSRVAGRAAPGPSAPGAPSGEGPRSSRSPAASPAPDAAGETAPQAARRETRERRAALARDVREAAGERAELRSTQEQALALLGAAVEYHVREAKPFWQEHFGRLQLPVDEWAGRGSAFGVERGRVVREWGVEPGRRTPSRDVELTGRMLDASRIEDSDLAAGAAVEVLYDQPVPPAVRSVPERAVRGAHSGGEIVEVRSGSGAADDDVVVLRERLRRGAGEHHQFPVALAPGAGPGHGPQEQAIEEAASAALRSWRADRRLPGGPAADLLERRPPRLVGQGGLPALRDHGDLVETLERVLRSVEDSYLAVQGPPGTGKTRLGSQVVARLVADGWRVGVVAQSHAAVENMLHAAVVRAGVPADVVAKKRHDTGMPRGRGLPRAAAGATDEPLAPPWRELGADELANFCAGQPHGCVVGGTAWDFAHQRWPAGGLDLLVIDEAGQFSLADTIAVARSARRLLLLGDPQQLPQVTQGRHPEPVDSSVLGWLAGTEAVLPSELGYFLDASWRMHPALCRKVSELAYSGRLSAHPAAAERSLAGVAPGVGHVLVPHEGNRVSSPEEADEVVRQVESLMGREWSDPGTGRAGPLHQEDVVVVAAYNAQVQATRRALAQAGLERVPVGTVDLFQGREAPVTILTLAASSPHDVSRGMGFLLSRNRLNVAVSRAQWRAVVVRSPRLTDYLPGDLEADGLRHLLDLGAFLRLTSA
ncbi:TM0106 family RecB-like putative nuclease [Myceligenerans salitolerans]|uniref:TM0106 family RecB-like putative nuclease n=1 Tax=Myceligenerans salitolerans TaxID=1230528 RepID=A0ABS3I8Y0_9MICO|nr:bifunctional RecB family nuclease/DEAD/DEAH box helicase [Myceligenerans salitolerans]MBO0609486.1 TM0106 family RecB-like putative nuclease [Myceligenerans salitolerans]